MNKLVLGLVLSSITVTELASMAQATPQLAAVGQKSSSPVCFVTKADASCESNVISQLPPPTDNGFVCPPNQPNGYVRCNSIVAVSNAHVCPTDHLLIGYARCHAMVVVHNSATPLVNLPVGYSPNQLLTAYQLTDAAKNSTSTTIAIVDAYDNPTIEADLEVYSKQYGLPLCNTANGCFKKVNQRGEQNKPPSVDSGWALEIALDVEIAHAICPNCKILLVEADSNFLNNLGQAVNQAVKIGANVVSNSYGTNEYIKETTYFDQFYNHPGVAIVASSGDTGYGVQYPAASPYVTAVGGTTLFLNQDNTRSSEAAWNGTGSGCSTFEPKPRWQPDRGCKNRTVVDVAADADPITGAAIYSSTLSPYGQGWLTLGGTGLSAPIIAGVYALAANSSSINAASHIYTNTAVHYLYNVTFGANGSCNNTYLCDASYSTQYGYNGPTGFGTPIGTNAF